MNNVKRIWYNEVPKTQEDVGKLYNMLEMIAQHIDKGMSFRIIIEELNVEDLPDK